MIISKNKHPLISIIICTFNSHKTISDTIKSIKKQNYKNYEIVIIDNNSHDNTLKIIKNFKIKNLKIISVINVGLYEAINIGIKKAKGKIISILHSDDFYYNKDVLSSVVKGFRLSNALIVYGDLLYVSQFNKKKILRYWKSNKYEKGLFRKGWSPPHPTFFCQKKAYRIGKLYNPIFGNSADIELMYRYLELLNYSSYHIKKILIVMRYGGVSNNSLKKIFLQNILVLKFLKIQNNPLLIIIFFF